MDVGTLLIIGFFVALMVGGVLNDARHRNARRVRLRLAAERLGGRFIEGPDGPEGDTSRVEATVSGRPVELSMYRLNTRKSKSPVARVLVPVEVGWGFELRPGYVGGLAFGADRVQTRDQAFDASYLLESDAPDLARRVFGAHPEASALPVRVQHMKATLSAGQLTVHCTEAGEIGEEHELELMRYTARLATIIEQTKPLVRVEGTSGGLSLSEASTEAGALTAAEAPAGAISPTQD